MSEKIERHGGRQHGVVPGRGKPAPQFLRGAQGFAIVASIGVGFGSFWGLRDFFAEYGGLLGWLLPLSIAVVTTSITGFLWHQLLELAAHSNTYRLDKIALVSGAAVAVTALTIAISAQFIIAAIGGPSAVRHHKHAYLAEVTGVVSEIEKQLRGADMQFGQVGQAVSELQSLLACELQRGCISGRGGGPGPASQEIERILASMSLVNDSVSGASQVQTARLDEVRAEIERARAAIREGEEAAFTDAVARLHAALSRAAGSATGGVNASALLASRYPQIAALGRRLLQADGMPERLDLDSETPVFLPIDKYEATQIYSHKVTMAHITGYAVELLPLLGFLIVLLAAQIRRDEDVDGDGESSGQRQLETDRPDIYQFGKRGVPAE